MALAKSKLDSLHAQYGEAAARVAHYRSLRGDGDPLTVKSNVEKELARWEGVKEALASMADTIGCGSKMREELEEQFFEIAAGKVRSGGD